jgi:hypothetical protein
VPLDRLIGFAFVWLALLAVMWDRVGSGRRAAARRSPVPSPT